MADRLASIFGTEKDKVNCPFYFKIGACRHGDRCSRLHNKPVLAQTIIIPNMYQSLALQMVGVGEVKEDDVQKHFDDFYEDVFDELSSFGELEEMHVCDNLGDHLIGNVYAEYTEELEAKKAVEALNGRFYAGRLLVCEFCPVSDFREARCRQFDMGECTRGGYCNFMHLKRPSPELERQLFPNKRRRSRSRSRSHSPPSRRGNSSGGPRRDYGGGGRDRGGGGGGGRDYRDRDYRDRDYRDYRDRDYRDRDRDYRDRDRDRDRERRKRSRSRSPRDRDRDRRRRSRSRSPSHKSSRHSRSDSHSPKRRRTGSSEHVRERERDRSASPTPLPQAQPISSTSSSTEGTQENVGWTNDQQHTSSTSTNNNNNENENTSSTNPMEQLEQQQQEQQEQQQEQEQRHPSEIPNDDQ